MGRTACFVASQNFWAQTGHIIMHNISDTTDVSSVNSSSMSDRLSRRFLSSVSIGVMVIALGLPSTTHAGDPDCTPIQSEVVDGDTVNCVFAAPGSIDYLTLSQDNLTVNIGDATTPTAVTGSVEVGEFFDDSATPINQTVNIINAGSSIVADFTALQVTGTGQVSITNEGSIIYCLCNGSASHR